MTVRALIAGASQDLADADGVPTRVLRRLRSYGRAFGELVTLNLRGCALSGIVNKDKMSPLTQA